MLYTKMRYARQISLLYRLRHMLHGRHADFGVRMGYRKQSRYYYALVRKLKEERILDGAGTFNETITNKWIAELPLYSKPEERRALGFRSPFNLYLSLYFMDALTTNQAVRGLDSSEKSVYLSMKRLADLSLISTGKSSMQINKSHAIFAWMQKYMHLAAIQADMDNDMSVLFHSVPGYIDGPAAYLMVNYVSGRVLGFADMIIRTSPLFKPFWLHVISNVGFLATYPRKIVVLTAEKDAPIEWISDLPYHKNADGDL